MAHSLQTHHAAATDGPGQQMGPDHTRTPFCAAAAFCPQSVYGIARTLFLVCLLGLGSYLIHSDTYR
jgi:hypothetical protein